jgi:hypothetical protein
MSAHPNQNQTLDGDQYPNSNLTSLCPLRQVRASAPRTVVNISGQTEYAQHPKNRSATEKPQPEGGTCGGIAAIPSNRFVVKGDYSSRYGRGYRRGYFWQCGYDQCLSIHRTGFHLVRIFFSAVGASLHGGVSLVVGEWPRRWHVEAGRLLAPARCSGVVACSIISSSAE